MPCILLVTDIDAPPERCFDLSLSVDFHIAAAGKTHEEAIAGITTGLMGLGDTVTWKAKHFGLFRTLTVEITKFERPFFFEDAMTEGAFKSMRHCHRFEKRDHGTLMTDEFHFNSPFGTLGSLADRVFLKAYMRRFLLTRNSLLKTTAESDAWRQFIPKH